MAVAGWYVVTPSDLMNRPFAFYSSKWLRDSKRVPLHSSIRTSLTNKGKQPQSSHNAFTCRAQRQKGKGMRMGMDGHGHGHEHEIAVGEVMNVDNGGVKG
jgi:hypothetical protein